MFISKYKIWTNTVINTRDFQKFLTVTPVDKSNKKSNSMSDNCCVGWNGTVASA